MYLSLGDLQAQNVACAAIAHMLQKGLANAYHRHTYSKPSLRAILHISQPPHWRRAHLCDHAYRQYCSFAQKWRKRQQLRQCLSIATSAWPCTLVSCDDYCRSSLLAPVPAPPLATPGNIGKNSGNIFGIPLAAVFASCSPPRRGEGTGERSRHRPQNRQRFRHYHRQKRQTHHLLPTSTHPQYSCLLRSIGPYKTKIPAKTAKNPATSSAIRPTTIRPNSSRPIDPPTLLCDTIRQDMAW
jgi:hypothetical protein